MEIVSLYIVVKFGVPVMIWSKSIQIDFRDMRTCKETAQQLERVASRHMGELSVEVMQCIRQKGQKK